MAALLPEQRKYRLAIKGGEDVLQLYTLIWYAWNSVSTYTLGRNGKARSRGGSFDVFISSKYTLTNITGAEHVQPAEWYVRGDPSATESEPGIYEYSAEKETHAVAEMVPDVEGSSKVRRTTMIFRRLQRFMTWKYGQQGTHVHEAIGGIQAYASKRKSRFEDEVDGNKKFKHSKAQTSEKVLPFACMGCPRRLCHREAFLDHM